MPFPAQFMSKEKITKITDCSFTGSFYNISQLPKDRLPQIAFAGRSNVGKSSLLNKLVGSKKMAKTSSTPGKTRSLNFFLVNNRFYFVDLPGYGYAKVQKKIKESWGKLVEDYLLKSDFLIGLVFLVDCRRELTVEDMQLLQWLSNRQTPVVVVITKTDKLSRDKINRKVKQVESELALTAIPFSTVTGLGKKELFMAIGDLVYQETQRMRN